MEYVAYIIGCAACAYLGWQLRPFVEEWKEVFRQ